MRILLLGCGNIGGALLRLWISQKIADQIVVVQPSLRSAGLFQAPGVSFVPSPEEIREDFQEDIMVLAFKPQNLKDATLGFQDRPSPPLIVSTLAGTSLQRVQDSFPGHPKIVRLMPNMAIKTGKSVHLTFMSTPFTREEKKLFFSAFSSSGSLFNLDREEQIDALTPIFGSGPAFFFLLADVLYREAVDCGLLESEAKKMIDLLVKGTASLVIDHQDYEDLIKSVCSKKGVTQAAMKTLVIQMPELLKHALKEALHRIYELKVD